MTLTKISNDGVKKPIDLADNEKIRIGAGNDLQIYHDGSNSYITEEGGGSLKITSSGPGIDVQKSQQEYLARFFTDGAVALYYDNVKTFATIGNGVSVIGPEGGNAEIELFSDEGDDDADKYRLVADGSVFYLQNYASGGWESNLKATGNGNVELFHDNSKKLETTSDGVTVTGTVSDSKGDLRKIPITWQNSNTYTLLASDAGKVVSAATNGTNITIPASVFSGGDAITIMNHTGNIHTITQGTGVTMYFAADGSTGNRSLAARGFCTLFYREHNVVYISGAGLS